VEASNGRIVNKERSNDTNDSDDSGAALRARARKGGAEPGVIADATISDVYFDTETTGLDPRADRLTWVGFAADDGPVELLRHPADRDRIQGWLELDAEFWAHNANFDSRFLELNGYALPARISDTALLANTAGTLERLPGGCRLTKLQKSLIELGELSGDVLEPETAIKKWLTAARKAAKKEGRPLPEKGDAPAHVLEPYLAADVASARAVHRHYSAELDGQAPVYELERRCLPAIYAVEKRGMPLDLEAAAELRDSVNANVAELETRLFELAGGPLNLNASGQIEAALVERGVDTTAMPRTPKSGAVMFTEQTLNKIEDDFARALLEWRSEKKMSDYVAGLWKHTHGDRLFGEFRQIGTQTGRMSSANPNLQNLPKSDLRVRYCIRATEGKVLVGADLDSVEMRVLACYAGEGELAAAFAAGVDPHQRTADSLGISRDAGKTLNYAVIYGAGAPLISDRLSITSDEAKALLERWRAEHPEIGRLKAGLMREVRDRGYLVSAGGRRHYFPDGPNHMLLNRLVSGSCADLFKMAAIELHEIGVPVIVFVHDEVVAEVPEDEAEETGRVLEEVLTRDVEAIRGLVAESGAWGRWSQFKDPEFRS